MMSYYPSFNTAEHFWYLSDRYTAALVSVKLYRTSRPNIQQYFNTVHSIQHPYVPVNPCQAPCTSHSQSSSMYQSIIARRRFPSVKHHQLSASVHLGISHSPALPHRALFQDLFIHSTATFSDIQETGLSEASTLIVNMLFIFQQFPSLCA